MNYIVNGHFTEEEARKLLRKYGRGRKVCIMAGTPLHIVKEGKPYVRYTAAPVRVFKEDAGVYLTRVFDIREPDLYKVNVTVTDGLIFLGGH